MSRRTGTLPVMRYGPHSDTVDRFLAALDDPAVRRRRVGPIPDDPHGACGRALFERALVARRVVAWDAARMTAASVAAPSQRGMAAGVALARVAADLLPDELYAHFTANPLGRLVERPGGSLAERCPCGMQLGERLVREVANRQPRPPRRVPAGPDCGHSVPALPTRDAVTVALGLVPSTASADWAAMLTLARRMAR